MKTRGALISCPQDVCTAICEFTLRDAMNKMGLNDVAAHLALVNVAESE